MSKDRLFDIPTDLNPAELILAVNDRLRRINTGLKGQRGPAGRSGGGSTIGGAGFVYYTKTLTANSSTLVTGAGPGTLVVVTIFEDATGGWVQTWPAAFVGMASFVQTTTASTYTAAIFYTPDGVNFQLVAAPVTGVS